MNNNSFFGGRQGAPFIIVNRFRYIDKTNIPTTERTKFVQPDATNKGLTLDQWYNKYCMVQAFSQGGSYTEVNYDEYVIIDSFNKNDSNNGKIYRRGYDITDSLGGALYIGQIVGPKGGAPYMNLEAYDTVKSKASAAGEAAKYQEGVLETAKLNLLPGKSGSTFNDKISFNSCNIVSDDGAINNVFMGFKVPYLVNEFAASSTSAYNAPTATLDSSSNGHPFYNKWNITIPKGIKGDTFKNLKVMVADSTIEAYDGQQDDINNKRKVLVYEYWNYDGSAAGSKKLYYLGDYNEIANVTLADDGTLTVSYTHNNSSVWSKKIKYIKSVSLADDGTLTQTYNTGTSDTFSKKIKWIKNVSLTDAGALTESFNDGTSTTFTQRLKWINNVTLADDGTLTQTYNTGTSDSFSKKIKWLNSLAMAADGTVTATYNTGTTQTMANKVKWITKTEVLTGSTEGTGNQKVKVTYNDNTSAEIGQPLNYIMKMALDSRYHLLALYSDPARRNALPSASKATYDGRSDWFDLGAVKSDSGLLIGLHFDTSQSQYSSLTNQTLAIKYLNENYPSGLTGNYIAGKVVSIGLPAKGKSIYAFDYGTNGTNKTSAGFNGWYYLGNVSTEGGGSAEISPSDILVVGKEGDATTEALAKALPAGGVWFIVRS